MKILIATLGLTAFFGVNAYGQANPQLKASRDSLKVALSENQYLKQTLNLLDSKIIKVKDDLEFKVLNVVSDNSDVSVTVTFTITNISNVSRRFQMFKGSFIDPQGNLYTSTSCNLGTTSYGSDITSLELKPDVVMKGEMKFKCVLKSPVMKVLGLEFYMKSGATASPDFTNVPVKQI